jgi:hypothetical protein
VFSDDIVCSYADYELLEDELLVTLLLELLELDEDEELLELLEDELELDEDEELVSSSWRPSTQTL